MGQLSPKQQLAFLLFNILYFGIGAGMVGVGIYNLLVIQGFGIFSQPYYLTGAVLFILVGVVKVVISIVGILGMFLQQKILVGIYIIVFGLILLPTLTAGVFGLHQWYYVFNEVGGVMDSVYNSSSLFNSTATLRQTFRNNYNCCGIRNGQIDYRPNTAAGTNIPVADCTRAIDYRLVRNTNVATQIGCQWYISDDIRYHLYYIGAIGLGFGFFELTSLLVGLQNSEGLI